MTQTPLKTRLGKRLKALLACIPDDCSEFYDLCCDHGALGRAVLESRPNCTVTFNDIHPDIMTRLQSELIRLNAERFQLDVGPAENLVITPGKQPVVMLAGVGDEQCITILERLLAQPAAKNAVFIVSPATKVFFVRKFLVDKGIAVSREQFVSENKRSYEILILDRRNPNDCYTSNDDKLFGQHWPVGNPDIETHIRKLIDYYQAKHRNLQSTESLNIVEGYQKILKKIKK